MILAFVVYESVIPPVEGHQTISVERKQFCRWDAIAAEICDYVLKKQVMSSLLEVKKNLKFHMEYLLARIKH